MVSDSTFSDCLTVSMFQPGGGLGDVEERVVDLVRRGGLAEWQDPVGAQRLRAARLDLEQFLPQDRVGADRRPALGADLRAAEREPDEDLIAVDLRERTWPTSTPAMRTLSPGLSPPVSVNCA